MKIYIINIPIKDNYIDNIFYLRLYILSLSSPSKDKVLAAIKNMHNREQSDNEYNNEWLQALAVVKKMSNFPTLKEPVKHCEYNANLVSTIYGLKLLTVQVIIPEDLRFYENFTTEIESPGC